jgi:hypothetical protein
MGSNLRNADGEEASKADLIQPEQAPASFLTIPRELRDQIYGELETGTFLSRKGKACIQPFRAQNVLTQNMLLINKQIYHEVREHLARRAILRQDVPVGRPPDHYREMHDSVCPILKGSLV